MNPFRLEITFLNISDELGTKLERGQAAIIQVNENKSEKFVPVNPDTADRLSKLDQGIIRFYNKRRI